MNCDILMEKVKFVLGFSTGEAMQVIEHYIRNNKIEELCIIVGYKGDEQNAVSKL